MSQTESKQVFQQRFNALLRRRGVTQKEVAAAAGVSTSTVSTWSKGLNMPRMDKLEKLAAFFGVPTSHFIDDARPLALDDISFALYEELRPLTRANQEKLLEMAKFFRQQQEREEK